MNYTITPLVADSYCTIAMAKKQLRIDADQDFDNDLIEDYRGSAIDQVENMCAVVFGSRVMVASYEKFEKKMTLPVWPVNSITSIKYKDTAGQEQTLPESDYVLFAYQETHDVHVTIKVNLPEIEKDQPAAVVITAAVGTPTVPKDVKQAVKLLISDSDTYREDKPMPGTDRSVNIKLRPYKY
jgi:uncharacterized phiE125 gp8 family phage protein